MTGPHPVVPGLTGLSVLARGGYATIYRAVQESIGRDVAVKVENRTLESERDRRRFLREARAAGRMSSHPYVVDLFDVGVNPDGHPYLIMELCSGSYADRIKTSPLTPQHARDVGVKIADALADAHSLGVLHRDVKPANILVTRFEEPVLADFGLAILAETRDVSITLDVLTPAYAPPEMFRQVSPAPSGDVYALCATLYALMHGRPPRWHEGTNPSLVSVIDMFAEPVPDLPGVPGDLMRVLRVGMANDPLVRPTAAQLRDTLRALPLEPAGQGSAAGREPVMPAWGAAVLAGGSPSLGLAEPANEDITIAHMGLGLAGQAGFGQNGGTGGGFGQNGGTGGGFGWPGSGHSASQVPGTGPGPGRRRARWGVLAGAGILALLTLVVTSAATGHGPAFDLIGGPRTSHTGTPAPIHTRTRQPTATPSLSGNAAACAALHDLGAHCPAAPECYDRIAMTGEVARARRLDCTAHHTWEAFAVADLPAELTRTDYQVVAGNPRVLSVCNAATLAMVSDFGVVGWRIEVLPPTPEAFRAGDRSYRCLAGKGDNGLSSPQFPRPGS